jgi:hypothetical protein
MTLRPFRDAFLAAASATTLVQLKFAKADVFLGHVLEPALFEPATILFFASLGIAVYRCVPGGRLSWFARDIQIHHRAFSAYSPIAGALAGWAVCLCIFQYWQFGKAALPAIAAVLFSLSYLVGVPVASYALISPVVAQFSGHGPTPRYNPRIIKFMGVIIIAVCGLALRHWWRGG